MQRENSESREGVRERERKRDREGRSQLAPGCSAGVLEGGNDSDFAVSIFDAISLTLRIIFLEGERSCSETRGTALSSMSSRISSREMELDQPLRFPCCMLLCMM